MTVKEAVPEYCPFCLQVGMASRMFCHNGYPSNYEDRPGPYRCKAAFEKSTRYTGTYIACLRMEPRNEFRCRGGE